MPKPNEAAAEIEDTAASGEDTSAGNDTQASLGADDLDEVNDLKAPAQSVRETVAAAAQAAADKAAGGAATAPAHWKDDDKKFFNGLKDRAVQDYLVKRDKDYQTNVGKAGSDLAALKKDYEPIAKLFEPHQEYLKRTGQTMAQVVGNYLQIETVLKTKPIEALAWLAKTYKADTAKLIAALSGEAPADEEVIDPATGELAPAALKPIDARIAKLEAAEIARIERSNAEQSKQLDTAVTKFEGAKRKDGNLLYPHATKPEIRQLMSVFIGSGAVNIETEGGLDKALVRAYEKAIRADEGTHAELLKSVVADNAAKEASERAERAKKARAASTSVSGGSSSAAASPGARRGSIRDQLGAVAETAGFTS